MADVGCAGSLSGSPSPRCLPSCCSSASFLFFFFFIDPAPTEIYTLSLHDALPILRRLLTDRVNDLFDEVVPIDVPGGEGEVVGVNNRLGLAVRSEEHTSELQSQSNLVCRLLLEKKKKDIGSQSRDG